MIMYSFLQTLSFVSFFPTRRLLGNKSQNAAKITFSFAFGTSACSVDIGSEGAVGKR
jgi:hypothetical protein